MKMVNEEYLKAKIEEYETVDAIMSGKKYKFGDVVYVKNGKSSPLRKTYFVKYTGREDYPYACVALYDRESFEEGDAFTVDVFDEVKRNYEVFKISKKRIMDRFECEDFIIVDDEDDGEEDISEESERDEDRPT